MLDAFELTPYDTVQPHTTHHELVIRRMLELAVTTARAACKMAGKMEDDGELDITEWRGEIAEAYHAMWAVCDQGHRLVHPHSFLMPWVAHRPRRRTLEL